MLGSDQMRSLLTMRKVAKGIENPSCFFELPEVVAKIKADKEGPCRSCGGTDGCTVLGCK